MKKCIAFCLFGFIAAFSYSQEQNIYEEIISRDVNSFMEAYKMVNSSVLFLEMEYETSNFIKLNELFTKIVSQTTNPTDVLPVITKTYWTSIKCMALSTLLYNNGNVKEENFSNGMRLMKDGLMLVLQGAEDMGLDIDSIRTFLKLNITKVLVYNSNSYGIYLPAVLSQAFVRV